VPPDYFSRTGQLWGNPVYDWDTLRADGFGWWVRRIGRALESFDVVRIDHFRGLVAYWEVPAGARTAIGGKWVPVPSHDFFRALQGRFGELPVAAEDLGVITPDVREVMKDFGFPGMKVLLFAFGDDNADHTYLPHMYEENCVAYTGTHDNNTVRGWFEKEASKAHKKRVFKYIGREVNANDIHIEFMKLLLESRADTVVFPLQDVLGLGQETRMNRPATSGGNWLWRVRRELLTDATAAMIRNLSEKHGRVM
jgi:4-alpha-glucanotransferase